MVLKKNNCWFFDRYRASTGASQYFSLKITLNISVQLEAQKQSTDDFNDRIFPGLLTAKCPKGVATFSKEFTSAVMM